MGYSAPGNLKRVKDFILSRESPSFRMDYTVRRGTVWPFDLFADGKPAADGGMQAFRQEDRTSFIVNADDSGRVGFTLPTEGGKLDQIGAASAPKKKTIGRQVAPIRLRWDAGFRPEAVKSVAENPVGEFLLEDRDGRSATLGGGGGRIRPVVNDGVLSIRVDFPAIDPASLGSVTGTVLGPDGKPVEGASVKLAIGSATGGSSMTANPDHWATTDVDGKFLLRSIERKDTSGLALEVSMIVSRDGFAGLDTPFVPFQPGQGDKPQVLDPIRLRPEGTIKGTVLDAKGQPVAGAWVSPGGGYSARNRFTRTDEAGRFAVRGVNRDVVGLSITYGDSGAHGRYVADGSQDVTIRLAPATKAGDLQETADERKARIGKKLLPGDLAPEWIVGEWSDGKPRALKGMRGKIVLLDFWGMWCSPCVNALPNLEAWRKDYEPKGVEFISIHTANGDPEQIRQLLKLKGSQIPFALDRRIDDGFNGETANLYGVGGYPTMMILDRDGKVIFSSNDPSNRPKMEAIVKELKFDEKKATPEDFSRLVDALMRRELDAILQRP